MSIHFQGPGEAPSLYHLPGDNFQVPCVPSLFFHSLEVHRFSQPLPKGLGEVDLATGSGQETQRQPATHGEGRRGELAAAHTIPEVDVTKRQRECRFIFDLQLLQLKQIH